MKKKGTEKAEKEMENNTVKTLTDTNIVSPLIGNILPLSEAKDEAFASEALGKGVVIEPTEGKVVAPFNGKVVTLFPTKHAIGLVSETGAEVLIHIGINTVELDGKCFDAKVSQGDEVVAGQTLVEFDIKGIEEAGYSTQTMIIITNTNDYASVSSLANGKADYSSNLLSLAK